MDLFLLTAAASLLLATTKIPNSLWGGLGSIAKAYGPLVVIYSFRLIYSLTDVDRNKLAFIYFAVIFTLVPFVYCNLNLLRHPFRLAIHEWVGDPIWVFAIPAISFFMIEYRAKNISRKNFLLVVVLELFLLFPIWTFAWAFFEIAVTDLFLAGR